MEVKQGEKYYLKCANGSGKSTFLNMLNNLSYEQTIQPKEQRKTDNKD
ncbi:MAG: ABC-type multidrug transport system ATPase subunit [Arenicella sp.]|jgi:ABC-type multidrug transport system ATPase subunit